jgi:ribulose-5-phosphate 4-epimerase/fuculose-1-phosphate aldolase
MSVELYYQRPSVKNVPRAEMSAAEWKARVDLAAFYRLSAHFGWSELVFTHISLNIPGEKEHFLLNPLGYCFDEICASDFVVIDIEGQPVYPTDKTILSAGFALHAGIHQARADANCVFHCHTPAGMAVAAMKEGLLPLSQHAMMFYGRTAYLENGGMKYDADERARMGRLLGDNTIMILRNHGLLVVGNTVADAFTKAFFLDQACKAQVQMLSTGRELVHPDDELARRFSDGANQKNPDGTGHAELFVWPAMLRMLDRLGGTPYNQ